VCMLSCLYDSIAVLYCRAPQSFCPSVALALKSPQFAVPHIIVWSGAYICPDGTDYCEACIAGLYITLKARFNDYSESE